MPSYDVAVVGAGPVGSVCALAHARKGARVALLEANPRAVRRLAGEWLHPPGARALRNLGVDLDTQLPSCAGRGFVVFPDDGGESIVFTYPHESPGLVCEHETLVGRLRETIEREPEIDYLAQARVREVEGRQLAYTFDGSNQRLTAGKIVGADGRMSVVRKSLGLSAELMTSSRMLGLILNDVNLPLEGYGHVLLGGPGPILIYRVAEERIRLIVDIPLDHWAPGDPVGLLLDAYAPLVPEEVRGAFVQALRSGRFSAAASSLRPRVTYGSPDRVLIGDAAGHYHPMTAMGMTLGFGDAIALAESANFEEFSNRRFLDTRAPELLAMGLYEVFADHRDEATVLRHAVYRNWRANDAFRERTVGLLACEDTSLASLTLAFGATVLRSVAGEIPLSYKVSAWRRPLDVVQRLAVRLGWALVGVRGLQKAKSANGSAQPAPSHPLAHAFLVSMPARSGAAKSIQPKEPVPPDPETAVRRAATRLAGLQRDDGAWEGEMVWCPMLTAQYVLLHHLLGRPLGDARRRSVLRHFERSRLACGQWGMHDHSPPNLFVTTLVYVAARLLGVERDDPLIEPARIFMQTEGVASIPSWGKFWLALLGLYDWRGVNPVLPELWLLPRWIPLHPSNWYCHTRLIYMAMAAIYARRFIAPDTPLIASLREELYPQGFSSVNFPASRNLLRQGDLFARPSVWLKAGYAMARLYDRLHSRRLRARCVQSIIPRIRWELNSSSHTNISPVSGRCFAGGWHGWPVSDCTAEAVLGLIAARGDAADRTAIGHAVAFMLRSQNRDGGFGSYEARRSKVPLEWLNPAEMFGESMTEHSFVECTASCLAALAAAGSHFPDFADASVSAAMSRADAWLRRTQASDGSWRGVWGVQFVYGTFFGVRGLLAAGCSRTDPALRLACRWLLDRQREDGGWGEHHSGCLPGTYVEHEESQVIQTAWALIALLEAGDSNWAALSRGAQFLLRTQQEDGGWPKQDMAGVFFRTALLDYVLYRQYFPLHALALYERRHARLDLTRL